MPTFIFYSLIVIIIVMGLLIIGSLDSLEVIIKKDDRIEYLSTENDHYEHQFSVIKNVIDDLNDDYPALNLNASSISDAITIIVDDYIRLLQLEEKRS